MKKPPCIRGLIEFKKGCPCRPWDGTEGCPAWIELLVTPANDPIKPKDKIGKCLDHWDLELRLKSLGLLEGNQQAIESFRNNMSTKDGPKPDPILRVLIESTMNQQLINIGKRPIQLTQSGKKAI